MVTAANKQSQIVSSDSAVTLLNRPVRTRMSGGVGGRRLTTAPYPDRPAWASASG